MSAASIREGSWHGWRLTAGTWFGQSGLMAGLTRHEMSGVTARQGPEGPHAGIESALALAVLGLRLVSLVQLAAATFPTAAGSSRPSLHIGLALLFFGSSTFVLASALRRRRLPPPGTVAVDIAVATVVLLGQFVIAPTAAMTPWNNWGFAIALSSAALAGAALRSPVAVFAITLGLWVAYLLAYFWSSHNLVATSSAVVNALAYAGFAWISFAVSRRLRSIATGADRAVAGAAAAENERHRRLLHDQATVLHLLSGEVADPELARALRAQAGAGAAAIAAFLASAPPGRDSRVPVDLAGLLHSCTSAFPDLVITTNADLVAGLSLQPAQDAAIEGAVTTLLHNVRRHAKAGECTVHADYDPSSGLWEIVVRDNGVGFDPATTRFGYGLTHQVRAALLEVGADCVITSAEGRGTCVTMTGRSGSRSGGQPWRARGVQVR